MRQNFHEKNCKPYYISTNSGLSNSFSLYYRSPLLSSSVLEFLALPQQHDERKTGCFLERGGGRGGGGGQGGGLQGLCSVSRNLLTPLASAESLRGGGGEEECRQEEDEEEHSGERQKAPAKLGSERMGGWQQADTFGGFLQ